MFSRNVRLGRPLKLSSWRKVAIGTWRSAGDPSVYGILEINAERALAYIEQLRARSGRRITLSHFVGKAVAETFRRHPDINVIQRWGRLYPRPNVDVFFQVASDGEGRDLSGMTIRSAQSKRMEEIAAEMEDRVTKIRSNKDRSFTRMKSMMDLLPGFVSSWILSFSGFLMYTLNLWTPLMGTPKDPFGSVMITNIGSLGLNLAFAPLVPYSRIPLLVAVGAVAEKVIAENGQPRVAPCINICVTFDHRVIDGVHASKMSKCMQKIFADPEKELS
ncbi:MAG: 2-oxo acid dehydrogenase subunit E2 [Bdellovibrionales bacterium]|nr:2-oxo acid dehydrogenase subunit E2 [Bdellovibrionales bacterium]